MSISMSAASSSLKKAWIERKGTQETLECQYNPTQYTLHKSVEWASTPARSAATAPPSEFIGTRPHTLSMALFFDGWESDRDIGADMMTLLDWTNPTKDSIDKSVPEPPILVFHWGGPHRFEAYLKSVDVTYELFGPDGAPLRGTANVTLQEVPADASRQNPTSGGVRGYRTHVLASGESLHSIAYREYRDAAYWRGLATLNGIDDPFSLQTGHVVRIPPIADVAAQS
jgi:hypothetical protein